MRRSFGWNAYLKKAKTNVWINFHYYHFIVNKCGVFTVVTVNKYWSLFCIGICATWPLRMNLCKHQYYFWQHLFGPKLMDRQRRTTVNRRASKYWDAFRRLRNTVLENTVFPGCFYVSASLVNYCSLNKWKWHNAKMPSTRILLSPFAALSNPIKET